MDRTIECASDQEAAHYVPPPIGNGELCLALDMEGIQRQRKYVSDYPGIWWAGRRYSDRLQRPMIPYGFLEHGIAEAPVRWTQRLNPGRAQIATDCVYPDGQRVETEAFVHAELPILALRKRSNRPYTLQFLLRRPGPSGDVPAHMRFSAEKIANGIEIRYEIEGLPERTGRVQFLCDMPARATLGGERFSLATDGPCASFFLVFTDAMEGAEGAERTLASARRALDLGFEGLRDSHEKSWSAYWEASHVSMPESREAEVYAVAQYHLRISTTAWSIPAGGISNHWQGAYYAFDEYFPFMALATSGRLGLASRIPAFRHKILRKARLRSFQHWGEEDRTDFGARYHFMCDENGDECTPPGYWLEHIFQMANVALCAWEYFRYGADRAFLAEKGYPVMAACAEFFRTQALYECGDGRLIVGKCTDLERLGPARENAFMTTCGVIATFESSADAAARLGIDGEKAAAWRALAERLRAGLPREDGRYVPHPGCSKKSISVLAGTFPYRVLPAEDPVQWAAISDFIASENEYGNMYPVGNSVCAWYAGWKGLTFARLGRWDDAHACLRAIAGEANRFSEIFEVRDPPMCPWFCTAEGTYIQLFNECLLASTEGEIRILAFPAPEYAFRLAAVGGILVEAAFEASRLCRLKLIASAPYAGNVILPDGREIRVDLARDASVALI
ncbi:MAG: hypothetical protein J0L75_11365 [Spirochaetes bacterium]|nr:hypothetical protein [Spirochaetota bacterium]